MTMKVFTLDLTNGANKGITTTPVYAGLIDGDWDEVPYISLQKGGQYGVDVYRVDIKHHEIFAGPIEELNSLLIEEARELLREKGALKTFLTRSGVPEEFLVEI